MKMRGVLSHSLVFLGGVGGGLILGGWLVTCPVHAGAPKYSLGLGSGRSPVVRQTAATPEPLWTIRCIGTEKDCGPATPIPAPGTLALVGIGLALVAGVTAWR